MESIVLYLSCVNVFAEICCCRRRSGLHKLAPAQEDALKFIDSSLGLTRRDALMSCDSETRTQMTKMKHCSLLRSDTCSKTAVVYLFLVCVSADPA